jgi:response regulator NasT
MRVWLVRDKNEASPGALENALRMLEKRPEADLQILGVSAGQLNGSQPLAALDPEVLDVLLIHERAWCDEAWVAELLKLGVAGVLALRPNQLERFRSLAVLYPLTFLSLTPDPDQLWLALWAAQAARQRQAHWKSQIDRLQQRLNDRIVIERAKGILVERLRISEEDAYKRLRVLSRRQRRQIRDIAQSLLDTQYLFHSPTNGAAGPMGTADIPEEQLPPEKT